LISLVLLVLSVQADDFKGQKVTLGKRKCTCDFRLDMKETCKGTAKCDKKCSGAGKVEVGGCSFALQVKKGNGKISKCTCQAAQPTIGPITGSGSGPQPPTGSGSGPSPPIGSGSGEQPVPLPGSGSGPGPQPPAGGEGMQCACKCDCPPGSGECDCDCNCPMNSQAVNCAPGFSKVCPMMGDQCPESMEQVCPSMPTTMPMPAGRMMGAGDRGCQCVPDFLLSLVMGAMTPAGRSAAVDRAMTKVTFKIGKTTCKCQYDINEKDCKRSKFACDKKCNGKISGLELDGGNYVMNLMVKKGKVAIQKCEAKTTEPTGTGGGPGSGPGNGGGSGMGSGPGSGIGGGMGGMGTRCACVSMGGGPMPPTGSGSGPMPPTGSGPNPPTGSGSGSGPQPPTGSGSTGAAGTGYSQAWLRGDEPYGHVHEGIRLEARDGWVGVGDRIKEEGSNRRTQVMVRRVDNDGKLVWTYMVGDTHTSSSKMSYSAGYSIIQSGDKLFVGGGLWQKNQNVMKAVVIALDVATGNMLWTKLLNSRPKNGGVRSVIMDGDRIIGTGYTNCEETGFLFVADGAEPMVWELSKTGDLVKESVLNVEGLGQGAKIRKDTSGFIVTSTAWAQIGGQDHEHVALIKLSSDLSVEWSKMYGVKGGSSQVFDMLVDRDGNYLCGGHTTIGTGVVNWDYLALKVNSQTRDVEWRKTYGQPRGFDPRYIHDEMYGVALDPAGNYLLLGGSGDEYPYSATNSTTGEQSDIWVSYLITVDTNGNTLAQGVYGNKLGNNAGEYLSVDNPTGEVMIFTDSDTNGGFGFLKLTPN